MLKLDEIKELIRFVDESSIQELSLEKAETKISIKKGISSEELKALAEALPAARPVQADGGARQTDERQAPAAEAKESAQPAKEEGLHEITAPMVGTFYQAPAPDADPYVKEGDRVEPDTVVCIVEAMKLMNEIEAEVKGTIVKKLVENGELVEYGQPLFLVKPE